MKIEDLERIVMISDPKISPSGKYTLFTATKASFKENKYISKIWIIDNEKKEYDQITNGPSDNSPEWAPDEKHFAFLSRRTMKEDEKGTELWIARIDGKFEPRLLLKLEGGISNVEWSPDGKKLLFLSTVGKVDEDVKVIERVPIWFNEKGFTYNLFSHLFVVDVRTGNYRQLTEGHFNVTFAQWSKDGSKIAFIAREHEIKPYIANIYLLDLKTNEKIKLTKDDFSIYDLAFSPDGKYLAFRGHNFPRGLSSHPKIWNLSIEDMAVKLLTDIDKGMSNAMNCDIRGPSSARSLYWIGEDIYFPLADRGFVHIYKVNMNGDATPVITGNFVVDNFSVIDKQIALTLMTSTKPSEVYLFNFDRLEQATHFNEALLEELKLNSPEHFVFKASDGTEIDGWILKPRDFKEDKKYPAILEIHGGPATAYGEGFMHEFHVLANEGYVVIFTNPRGSAGYSEEFRDIRGKYGDRDYKDLMEALDFVIKNYAFIDENRIGVTGGSYGGFMTNWIIGHTDRFKAAVTQRSICNWISDYGTTDIGFYFNEDQIAEGFGRPFWDEKWFSKYWEQSPIKYIGNAKTPLLIIHSLEDYRCWLDQALQMFTALKVRGIDTRLVLFPKENHDLSRKGKPNHRKKRLEEIIKWFNRYLKQETVK